MNDPFIIHRGGGYYLVEARPRLVTWAQNTGRARLYNIQEAALLVPYINDTLQVNCEAISYRHQPLSVESSQTPTITMEVVQ